MARKQLYRTRVFPYHVTARANNRESFPLALDRMWELIGFEAFTLDLKLGVEIQNLVLMPNHFHMILTVPEADLGISMNQFMSGISRSVNRISGRTGHVFGAPYHWSLIRSSRYFGHAFKYTYRNPVKARLCTTVEDYPYSTLSGLLGRSPLPFPIYYTRAGMELALPTGDPSDLLSWLNTPFAPQAEQLIQRGIRKKIFDSLRCPETRRPHEILQSLA